MKQCSDMSEVRQEIDRIDQMLVPLLIERLGYVGQAGKIKPGRDMVRDTWRIEDVVAKATRLITDEGHKHYVEGLYRHLIELSIEHEYKVWDSENKA